MKRYLWTAVAVLFVNASASENPFALKENLLKIDNDQEMLLLELSKIAETREDSKLAEDANKPEAKVIEIEEFNEAVPEEGPIKMEDSEEQYNLTNAIDELVDDDKEGFDLAATLENLVEEPEKKEPVSTAVADESQKKAIAQAKAEAKKAEESKKAEEAKLAIMQAEKAKQEEMQRVAQKEAEEKLTQAEKAREEERREVEAYEKERAEKLAKAKKLEEVKKAEEAKLQAEKAKKEQEKAAVVKVQTKTTEITEEKTVMQSETLEGDINIEAEQKVEKESADAAYLEAIREMDQEED